MQPPRTVYRAGLDAAILAAVLPADFAGAVVDLGCGAGAVAFGVAVRCPAVVVTGVERDTQMVALARAGLELPQNAGFAARVSVTAGDVRDKPEAWEPGVASGQADAVLLNPPFTRSGHGRISPVPGRQSARAQDEAGLSPWLLAARRLLRPGGLYAAIAPAQALADLLAPQFGAFEITPVHGRADMPAKRIVVAGRLGRRAGPQIMPPLVLHGAQGTLTTFADALTRGRMDLGQARGGVGEPGV